MSLKKLLVAGAGGQAKVVLDALKLADSGFLPVLADDDPDKRGSVILGFGVTGPIAEALTGIDTFHVAIGQNLARERLSDYLTRHGLAGCSIFHERASISRSARLADGVFVAACGIIGPDAHVESGGIINHGAVVDHDCWVGAFSHIAPNATLGGQVRLGKRVLVGAGANVLPGVSVGDDCVVGAGAVVVHDLDPGCVYLGVPARKL